MRATEMTDAKCEPPLEWEAECGVCGALYGWSGDDEPPAHGVFCNHCRSNGLSAPGVLHFTRTSRRAPVTPPATVAALVEMLKKTERQLVTWYRLGSPAGNVGSENAFADADPIVKEARAALAAYREAAR